MKITRITAAIALTLLFTSPSQAEVPFMGCYVEENNQCAGVEITCGSNSADNYAAFDVAIGGLCDQVLVRDQQIASLNEYLTNLTQTITSQGMERDAYKTLYTQMLSEKTANALRIRKMKRVCGRKCRRL